MNLMNEEMFDKDGFDKDGYNREGFSREVTDHWSFGFGVSLPEDEE